MITAELIPTLSTLWRNGSWFQREASRAIGLGHFQAILGRTHGDLYLLRCWLTPPVAGRDREWESGDSLLIHWIVQPDDDLALHDHPWDFTSTILQGGYYEEMPHLRWTENDQRVLGPILPHRCELRSHGSARSVRSTDLHRISRLLAPGQMEGGGTWTMVRTSRRVRAWGFHPPGEVWCPWADRLGKTP